MRVISLVGARPQFIKEAIIHRELKNAGVQEILVNSGQHYDHNMSDVFLSEFEIKKPDYNMSVGSGSHGEMTGRIMIEFEKIALTEKPDWVLVYGDTNTTLAGAIVAAKLKIPVAHVEAGVRMFPKDMPEEINRTLTDRVSRLLLCASQKSIANLRAEGIESGVHFTGDVMYDLFLQVRESFKFDLNREHSLKDDGYCVLTLHRDYNVDSKERLEGILVRLDKLAAEIPIVFPIHPRTKKRVEEFGFGTLLKRMIVTEPLDYLTLMGLVSRSKLVLTDSGGLQKEAYYAGKPALLFMQDPAWHELVEEGVNHLVGDRDLTALAANLKSGEFREGIYGRGDASRKIVQLLLSR
ncbi:MAG: UDP-N-acetylglucosamine 2-epimerase (non-hydrolyzing) [Deltaproteobacteria bacterium]|nr:UDP-N-acetylglucosamine 2-epimerase (non-hydrolyzing) [Deltaproteobacteria bacterium]